MAGAGGAAAIRAERRRADRVVAAVREELRRRIGPTFSADELAELYGRGTDWCLQVALDVAPALASDPQSIADAAFWLYLRGRGRLRRRPPAPRLSCSASQSSSPPASPGSGAPGRRMTIWSGRSGP